MLCDDLLDLIGPIASGELTPESEIAAHLATCPNCTESLEGARRLERLLETDLR